MATATHPPLKIDGSWNEQPHAMGFEQIETIEPLGIARDALDVLGQYLRGEIAGEDAKSRAELAWGIVCESGALKPPVIRSKGEA